MEDSDDAHEVMEHIGVYLGFDQVPEEANCDEIDGGKQARRDAARSVRQGMHEWVPELPALSQIIPMILRRK